MIPFTPTPVLFSVGPIAVRYYGLAFASGFLLSYFALRKSALREHADDLILWIMVGVIAGGRIGEFIFYSPRLLWQKPLEIFMIWHGGMSFHGGLIGCLIGVWLYCRKHKLSLLDVADITVLPTAIGLVLGRTANFLNGELVGTVTNVPWCVVMDGVTGCRHPSPIYEALYTLVIVVVLACMIFLSKSKRARGTLFATFLILYGLFRFIVNFWRDDLLYFGISTGQYLSLFTLVAGVWLMIWTRSLSTQESSTVVTGNHKKRRRG